MTNQLIVDEIIAEYTSHALRDMLLFWKLTADERSNIIAALYYLEGTENND